MKTLDEKALQYYTDKMKIKLSELVSVIGTVPSQSGTLAYTGEAQSPDWNSSELFKMDISGVTSAVEAGKYATVFTPKPGFKWADKTSGPKSVEWEISRAVIDIPSQSGYLVYTGEELNPTFVGCDSNKMTISGTESATNAGTYTAVFTPKANYQWADGSVSGKNVTWEIDKAIISVPTISGTLVYTGSAQTPAIAGYDSSKMIISGTQSATNAGNYSVTFAPETNYKWVDGSVDEKTVSWTIGKANVMLPTVSGSLTYTGDYQSPTFVGYDDTQLTLGGDTSGINAGNYTAYFTPTENYQWADGSIEDKPVVWSIGKAAGSFTLSVVNLVFPNEDPQVISVNREGTGMVSAVANDPTIVSISVNGTDITVTPLEKGDTIITIDVAEDANYTAANSKICTVKVGSPQIKIRVVTKTDKTPIANLPITGMTNAAGSQIYTDDDGYAAMDSINATKTFSITGYADIQDYSATYTMVEGESYEYTWEVTTVNFRSWTYSGTTKLSTNVLSDGLDVAVGGGGGGGAGAEVTTYSSTMTNCRGGGGGGGYVATATGVSFVPNENIAYTVGAGGTSGRSNASGTVNNTSGGTGGSSQFLNITASGGGKGTGPYGGSGNGSGGTGSYFNKNIKDYTTPSSGGNGTGEVYLSFTQTIKWGGGGGGGNNLYLGDAGYGGSAGVGGGITYRSEGNGSSGSYGGGGGGGAYKGHMGPIYGCGGSGSRGIVTIRMRLRGT